MTDSDSCSSDFDIRINVIPKDVHIDKIINIKTENKRTITNTDTLLKNFLPVFVELKKETEVFRDNILNFIELIGQYGSITDQMLDLYNKKLFQYLLTFKLNLKYIRPVTECDKYCFVTMTYKLADYQWIKNYPLVTVDNVSIDVDCNTIFISENTINFLSAQELNTNNTLLEFINNIIKEINKLKNIIDIFTKDILMINRALEYIQVLIKTYNLL